MLRQDNYSFGITKIKHYFAKIPGLLQKDHPGIAIAIKTRHANRAVLNQMRSALSELKEDGTRFLKHICNLCIY